MHKVRVAHKRSKQWKLIKPSARKRGVGRLQEVIFDGERFQLLGFD